MLNIDYTTAYYIKHTFQENVAKQFFSGFSLLEDFGLPFYEDRYTNLLSDEDSPFSESTMDIFVHFMKEDLLRIITDHSITMELDEDLTLGELLVVTDFLYRVQHLEDYTDVDYRIHSGGNSRDIFIDLLVHYTTFPRMRLMEIIDAVGENLIRAITAFIVDKKESSADDVVDREHVNYIHHFLTFIDHTACLGGELFYQGYSNLTLAQLDSVVPFNFAEKIEEDIPSNTVQAALNVMSTLVVTRDNYINLIDKFKQNIGMFVTKNENVILIEQIFMKFMNDFTAYLKISKERELANVKQA